LDQSQSIDDVFILFQYLQHELNRFLYDQKSISTRMFINLTKQVRILIWTLAINIKNHIQ